MKLRSATGAAVVALAVVTGGRPAHADDDDTVGRVDAVLQLQLADGGDSISLSPDLWYRHGFTWELGVVHSSLALAGFHGLGTGHSLCLRGPACDLGSPRPYHEVGVLGTRSLWSNDSAWLRAEAGLVVADFSPFALGTKLGARLLYVSDSLVALTFDPHVIVGITGDDRIVDRVSLPVSITALTLFGIETGAVIPMSGAADGWQMPLSIVVGWPVSSRAIVRGALTFPAVAGGDAAVHGFDEAVVTLGIDMTLSGE